MAKVLIVDDEPLVCRLFTSALRAQGHAAAISGAGPSVIVLATSVTVDDVRVPADTDVAWQRLTPGVPHVGVGAVRATLGTSLGERAATRRIEL